MILALLSERILINIVNITHIIFNILFIFCFLLLFFFCIRQYKIYSLFGSNKTLFG